MIVERIELEELLKKANVVCQKECARVENDYRKSIYVISRNTVRVDSQPSAWHRLIAKGRYKLVATQEEKEKYLKQVVNDVIKKELSNTRSSRVFYQVYANSETITRWFNGIQNLQSIKNFDVPDKEYQMMISLASQYQHHEIPLPKSLSNNQEVERNSLCDLELTSPPVTKDPSAIDKCNPKFSIRM